MRLRNRTARSLQIGLSGVLSFRNNEANAAGTVVAIAVRLIVGVLLALTALAIRRRVKRYQRA
jgi:hypothetical protein